MQLASTLACQCSAARAIREANVAKFSPVDLEKYFNLTPGAMTPPWHAELLPLVHALPAGQQTFWGIPFPAIPTRTSRERICTSMCCWRKWSAE